MDATSVRHTTPEVTGGITPRIERGIRLFDSRGEEITADAEGRWFVPACSGRGGYRVTLGDTLSEDHCSCPDHARHGEELRLDKHTICARLAAAYRKGAHAYETERRYFELLAAVSCPVAAGESLMRAMTLEREVEHRSMAADRRLRGLVGAAGERRSRVARSAA